MIQQILKSRSGTESLSNPDEDNRDFPFSFARMQIMAELEAELSALVSPVFAGMCTVNHHKLILLFGRASRVHNLLLVCYQQRQRISEMK